MAHFDDLVAVFDKDRGDRDPKNDVGKLDPTLSFADAYRVQFAAKARRVAKGDRIVGRKASFTSSAVVKQFPDFPAPLVGTILASHLRENGATIDLNADSGITFVENEIGALMKRDLEGPGVTPLQALAAIEGFFPAIEIAPLGPGVLERTITNQHIIAKEKADGGYLIVGSTLLPPGQIDVRFEGCVVSINGKVVGSGAGVEAMGSPVNVVAAVANRLAEFGEKLRAGEIVITGALCGPARAVKGDREAVVEFTRLGRVSVRFEA